MAREVPGDSGRVSGGFRKIVDVFLSGEGLPFSKVLSADRIERICRDHNCLFGLNAIYSASTVLWAFLSQVLRDGKEASCRAAVAGIVAWRCEQGLEPPTEDTGDYCRARAKLAPQAIKAISCEVAEELEQAAKPDWLWKGMHHAKLIDGFTFTMPDTQENQKQYPQLTSQKPGIGLPIARATAIMSLATGAVMNMAFGRYQGKETGETALLRSMLDSFHPGDIAVVDRYYCSFMMIALFLVQGTHACARKHHLRHTDFRRGKRLGKHDHLIVWTRPVRPTWMREATYARIPETLVLREIRYAIVERGRRTHSIDVITTLTDADMYAKQDIADLYGFRWNSELDIRSIKSNLNLGHVRCKSPEMVHREVWTTLLGYNLIRMTASAAALLHDKTPRQISFTSTCQYVLASWTHLSSRRIDDHTLGAYLLNILKQIAACAVADRPGRFEPRVIKRRRHRYPIMRKPRAVLRKDVANPRA